MSKTIRVPGISRDLRLDEAIANDTPNFTWGEATHGGTRIPVDANVTGGIIRVARLAQQIRNRLGKPMRITSWYRDPVNNRRVRGARDSRHLYGDAIDFYVDGYTTHSLYQFVENTGLVDNGGLGKYAGMSIVHIDARGSRARWYHA